MPTVVVGVAQKMSHGFQNQDVLISKVKIVLTMKIDEAKL